MKHFFQSIFIVLSVASVGLFSCQSNPAEDGQTGDQLSNEDSTSIYVPDSIKSAPEWSKNSTIYEVNLRQYSESGSLKDFETHLPRLKELGVDILWFMPIHPIGEKNRKGTMGSYYSVKDYKAIDPSYGTIEEFKSFVERAHAMGFHVILDWVANHSAFDNVWIQEGHTEYYTLDSVGKLQPPIGTDWWDVADLNYDNKEMRAAMIEALKFWITECDVDGYRCDVADWVPVDFWNEARMELDQIKPVFMLAEADSPELHEKAFDMTYGWGFHFLMMEMAKGEKTVDDLTKYVDSNRYQPEDYRLHFITNHDENSWKGSINERLGDKWKPYAALAATLEGMPLIYSGQEFSLNKRLKFFEKDVIDWTGTDLTRFYQRLNQINKRYEPLWNGSYGAPAELLETNKPNTFAFSRSKNGQTIVCMFNFTEETVGITLPILQDKMNTCLLSNRDEDSMTIGEANGEFMVDANGFYIFEVTIDESLEN